MNALWASLQLVWVALAALGVGFLLQNDVASHLGILGVRPDLLLGILVVFARRLGRSEERRVGKECRL